MYKTDYSKLDIDTSDIWKYEFDDLQVTHNFALYDKLLTVIEPIMSLRTKPFLEGKTRTDNWAKKYYSNYPEKYKSRSIDYFEFDGDYYEYNRECLVNLELNELKDFSFLFALKLRQYKDNLSAVDNFLYYQVKVNFGGSLSKFLAFIKSMLIQFPDALGELFEKKINLWEAGFDSSLLLDDKDEWFWESDESWEPVDVFLSDDDVKLFFAFLYQEINDKGRPYLQKKEVEQIFRFGFKVPPMPLKRKFKLNLTPKNRKSVIEQCFYRFFEEYGSNQKNKLPFLKFLAYTMQDFEKIQTPKQFDNWGKNFTSSKFKKDRLPFSIERYIDLIQTSRRPPK